MLYTTKAGNLGGVRTKTAICYFASLDYYGASGFSL